MAEGKSFLVVAADVMALRAPAQRLQEAKDALLATSSSGGSNRGAGELGELETSAKTEID